MSSSFNPNNSLISRLGPAYCQTIASIIPGGVDNLCKPLTTSQSKQLLSKLNQAQAAITQVSEALRRKAGLVHREGVASVKLSEYDLSPLAYEQSEDPSMVPVTVTVRAPSSPSGGKPTVQVAVEGLTRSKALTADEHFELLAEVIAHRMTSMPLRGVESSEQRLVSWLKSIGILSLSPDFSSTAAPSLESSTAGFLIYGVIPSRLLYKLNNAPM